MLSIASNNYWNGPFQDPKSSRKILAFSMIMKLTLYTFFILFLLSLYHVLSLLPPIMLSWKGLKRQFEWCMICIHRAIFSMWCDVKSLKNPNEPTKYLKRYPWTHIYFRTKKGQLLVRIFTLWIMWKKGLEKMIWMMYDICK